MKSRLLFVFFTLVVANVLWAQNIYAQNSNSIQKTSKRNNINSADYVFKNGAVYTMDSKNPTAEAIAISGKKIVYVGNNAGVQAFIGNKTKVTDLQGQMLLPGFVEAHIHPALAILTVGADLQSDTIDEVLAKLKSWADAHSNDKIVRGFGWRATLFPPTGPTKEMLDKVIPDRPVILIGVDGHSAWVNSKALQMAGISSKTADPAPGFSYYHRDQKTNEPTGSIVESLAMQELNNKLDPMSPDKVLAACADLLPKFAASGITAIFDAGVAVMPTELALEGYQELEKKGKLPLRIVGSYYWNNPAITDPVDLVMKLKEKFHSELVQATTLKINIDGGDLQHTSVMIKPYADSLDYHGEFLLGPRIINPAISKAQANGINTHAHALGDGAVKAYLDAVEAARKAYPNSVSRHTNAHAVYMTDEEVARFAKLNATYQASPQWNTPDPVIELSTKIIGKDVMFREMGRINSVLKAGGRVAFGTDWPAANYVSTYRPLDAIQVALTRAILPQYGTKQFMPVLQPENECITLDEALKANTLDAAFVLGLENKIGSLKVGKAADIVVLEKDLHKIAPNEISNTKIILTMMNGKITYEKVSDVTPPLTAAELGLMQGFPAVKNKQVNKYNYMFPPYNRWSFQHMRYLNQTAPIKRGNIPVSKLEISKVNILDKNFTDNSYTHKSYNLKNLLVQHYTDAFIVLHNGKIVTEYYANGMTPSTPHWIASMTKSVQSTVAEILINRGILDDTKKVEFYIPELKGTMPGSATIREVLDMNVAIVPDGAMEGVKDPNSYFNRFGRAVGFLPNDGSENVYQILPQIEPYGVNGGKVRYASATAEISGWVISKVTNKPLEQVISEELWSKLGTSGDTYTIVDPALKMVSTGGINTTLRDYARFGMLIANRGKIKGVQIIPKAVIQKIISAGDHPSWKASDFASMEPVIKSYRSYWYITENKNHGVFAWGIHGQHMYVDPTNNIVIVQMSSLPNQSEDIEMPMVDIMVQIADMLAKSK
ncbi:MAG TPA: amidohydrolase family protein [Sediminibacterium sp.]|nr:amidohydrolase family protein [Sediminibacterium sp.]